MFQKDAVCPIDHKDIMQFASPDECWKWRYSNFKCGSLGNISSVNLRVLIGLTFFKFAAIPM